MVESFKDIILYARLPMIIYADGYAAQIVSQKEGKNQDGKDVWDFVLNPTPELIKRYKLKANSEENMLYEVQLPYDLVIQLNPDPSWERWLYLGNYNGESTVAIKTLGGFSQQKIIEELKKKIQIEQIKREFAEEKLHLMETNMSKYMKRNVTPFLEEFSPFIEKMINKSEKK